MRVLDGPRIKLARGQSHLDAINVELTKALDLKAEGFAIGIRKYPYPQPLHTLDPRPWLGVSIYIKSVPELPVEVSLLMGEAMHHFRGALDHAIWIAVRRGQVKLTARQAQRVAFPMARSKAAFDSGQAQAMPGLNRDVVALIERYQPYRRSYEARAIRRLRQLTNTDKHRLIVPTPAMAPEGEIVWGPLEWKRPPVPVEVQSIPHLKGSLRIKPGTEIVTNIYKGITEDDAKVNVRTKVAWCFTLPRSVVTPIAGELAEMSSVLLSISMVCERILEEIEGRI